jgi:hypothetical protein
MSYDGGLGALVSEIKQASENIAQADAKTPGASNRSRHQSTTFTAS